MLRDCEGIPDAIIIATGSEVELAVAPVSRKRSKTKSPRGFDAEHLGVRQSATDYRDSVIPPGVRARIAVEAAVTAGWYKYVGMDGVVIGIDTFGESAPAKELFAYFGFTVDKVVEAVNKLLETD